MAKKEKYYYPVGSTGSAEEKEAYLNLVNFISTNAVKTDVWHGDFYDYYRYTTAGGTVYEETFNTEYGYSYSIERL